MLHSESFTKQYAVSEIYSFVRALVLNTVLLGSSQSWPHRVKKSQLWSHFLLLKNITCSKIPANFYSNEKWLTQEVEPASVAKNLFGTKSWTVGLDVFTMSMIYIHELSCCYILSGWSISSSRTFCIHISRLPIEDRVNLLLYSYESPLSTQGFHFLFCICWLIIYNVWTQASFVSLVFCSALLRISFYSPYTFCFRRTFALQVFCRYFQMALLCHD